MAWTARVWNRGLLFAAVVLAGGSVAAQQPRAADVHRELEAIYRADQADRQGALPTDPQKIKELVERDSRRRQRMLEMVRGGQLQSAQDYENAAMVFQHGDKPEDYLLAHVLATVAGFRGRRGARWLSAAALDRYLQSIDRPQVFGTQYRWSESAPVNQAPYDRELLTDMIRSQYGVPPLSEQDRRARKLEESRGGKATQK